MTLCASPKTNQELIASITHDIEWVVKHLEGKAKITGPARTALNRLTPALDKLRRLEAGT